MFTRFSSNRVQIIGENALIHWEDFSAAIPTTLFGKKDDKPVDSIVITLGQYKAQMLALFENSIPFVTPMAFTVTSATNSAPAQIAFRITVKYAGQILGRLEKVVDVPAEIRWQILSTDDGFQIVLPPDLANSLFLTEEERDKAIAQIQAMTTFDDLG